jgi:hypothetical protein
VVDRPMTLSLSHFTSLFCFFGQMHLQNDKRGLLSIKGFDVEHDDVFYLSSNDLGDEELRTVAKDGRVPVTITLDLEKADQDAKEDTPQESPEGGSCSCHCLSVQGGAHEPSPRNPGRDSHSIGPA